MVGAGIFSLPRTFGAVTGPFGAVLAWVIAGAGMYTLACVFRFLAEREPTLDAGVFAYAKAGFGDYPGFPSAFGYRIGSCFGNVSYGVLIKSTLGAFFPVFGSGNMLFATIELTIFIVAILGAVSGAPIGRARTQVVALAISSERVRERAIALWRSATDFPYAA